MDPRTNPFAPGAGRPPPELAGRDDVVERAAIALDRLRDGRSARSFIFYGLRGVGKTVLLNHVRREAEGRKLVSVRIEAPEGRSLPGVLAPALRAALVRLDRLGAAKAGVGRAMTALAGFAKAFKVSYQDVELSLDLTGEPGLADSGDLEIDLTDLLASVGEAAAERRTAVAIYIDELQYVPERQLAALIGALHAASQDGLPVTLMAAGLPQLLGLAGDAKSYAERLFEFTPVDRLTPAAAADALRRPAGREGVVIEEAAVEEILRHTRGYPYFLQEWGKHSWDVAETSPIRSVDAERATAQAIAELDASFFQVRFDRLTQQEKRYLRAMAALGEGPHRSGDIAALLGRKVSSAAALRATLIEKGMIYSRAHGDTAFTVPLFDGFMKRIMPEFG